MRIEGQPLASVLGIKSRFIGNGGEECSVEELALQYYAAEDKGAWTGEPNTVNVVLRGGCRDDHQYVSGFDAVTYMHLDPWTLCYA